MMIHYLPHEITLDIFSRLPFEYVIRCKEVCKTWRNILRHIKGDQKVTLLLTGKHENDDHMTLYHVEYDEKDNNYFGEELFFNSITPLTGCPYIDYNWNLSSHIVGSHSQRGPLVGSERGLVCFYETHDNVYDPTYICNPFSRETVLLPRLSFRNDSRTKWRKNKSNDSSNDFLVSGFGYLHATNEYKVVRIHYSKMGFCGGRVQVYTLGDKNGWREKKITDRSLRETNGILYNGALHWFDIGWNIVAFDLADEEFRFVPTPTCFNPDDELQLLLLRGSLSIVHRRRNSSTKITIWSWLFWWPLEETENRSGHKHWRRQFGICSNLFSPPAYHPLALTEENGVLLWHHQGGTLFHYDPETEISNKFVDVKRFQGFQAIPYKKSDVSLALLMPDRRVDNWE